MVESGAQGSGVHNEACYLSDPEPPTVTLTAEVSGLFIILVVVLFSRRWGPWTATGVSRIIYVPGRAVEHITQHPHLRRARSKSIDLIPMM